MHADLVDALTEHGAWLRDSFPGKRQADYGLALLDLAGQVAASAGSPLPEVLRTRLRALLPAVYRARGEDVVRPVENAAYHARLSRLSEAIERELVPSQS